MAIIKLRPMTPGTRHQSKIDTRDLAKKRPEKALTERLKKNGGRNHRGIITVRHRGGGHKRLYRIIDWKRNDRDDITAKVAAIEYDPNRSARIALLHYADGVKRYILAPFGLQVGQHVISGEKVEPEIGNCMPLESIPLGLAVHNVEVNPGQGGKLARAANMQVTLASKEGPHAIVILPSGEMRRLDKRCRATIGSVGNPDHGMVSIGKAGRKRHMGWRPTVRGSTMNPVDHPLGGGEGRHAGGHHFKSPTGIYARGGKTRSPSNRSNNMIMSRRKK